MPFAITILSFDAQMNWKITYPHRETLRYETAEGSFDFEMAWGANPTTVFIRGNTFFTQDGRRVSVTDSDIELFTSRIREHAHKTKEEIEISRSKEDNDYLPSRYK
jgi:hypothetical protein